MNLPLLTNPTASLRQANLARLIDERAEGNAAEFSRQVNKDRRQVSAWATGRKKMSDETAREIEAECRLPVGWMDREHSGVSQSVHEDSRKQSHPVRTDPAKVSDAQTLLRHLAELWAVPELVNDPVAIAFALDVVVEFDAPLTNDNVLDITKRLASRIKGEERATQERSSTEGTGGAAGSPGR